MNKHIEAIERESYTERQHERGGTYMAFDKEKFALLIVGACVQACIDEGQTFEVESAGEYSSNLYASAIKRHFGVEL